MGKGFAAHRVVIQNDRHELIRDDLYDSFATAEPAWQAACDRLKPGQSVALQHGARLMKVHPPGALGDT